MKAFPNIKIVQTEPPGTYKRIHNPGMDLRDYFAAKAMQGMMSNSDVLANYSNSHLVAEAYRVADAMIKQRGNPK